MAWRACRCEPPAPRPGHIGTHLAELLHNSSEHRARVTDEVGGHGYFNLRDMILQPGSSSHAQFEPFLRVAPNLLIRAMALFDGSIRSVVSDLGQRSWFSSQKARNQLGWTTRPVEDSIEQYARSLL